MSNCGCNASSTFGCNVNGCGQHNCTCCNPYPTCDSAVPTECNTLGITLTPSNLVVEDPSSCKHIMQAPEKSSILTYNAYSGLLYWDTGESVCLPDMPVDVGTPETQLVVKSGDCLHAFKPNYSAAEKQILIANQGDADFEWKPTSDIYPDGCGVLTKDCGGATADDIGFQTGTEGQILSINSDGNPRFINPSAIVDRTGFIDAQSISGQWVNGSTLIYNFGQLVVVNSGGDEIVITNPSSKTLNLVTTGAGGLDTGSLGNSLYYYVFAIYDKTNSLINVLASLSQTNPTLPTGYTYFRAIGLFRTSAGGLVASGFAQSGRSVVLGYDSRVVVFSQGPTPTTVYYSGVVNGYAPSTAVNSCTMRLDGIGVTSTYECNCIIAASAAASSGAAVSLAQSVNQYGSTSLSSTRTGINCYSQFNVTIPYSLTSYYNIYYAAAIPSGDSAQLSVTGYTLTLF